MSADDSSSGPEKDLPTDGARGAEAEATTEEKASLSGLPLFLVMFGLALALFLIALDTSIVATAIPYITEQFHSTADIGWYGAAYFLTLCALQPTSGRLFATFSLKWTFLCFFALFEIGSLICATAVNSNMFIAGRALAGAGGTGIVSGGYTIIAAMIPLPKRPLYIGLLSAVFGIATVVGPMLGGAFTQHVTWRWCFYINLPIGGASSVALVGFFNPPTRPQEKTPVLDRLRKLDFIGAAIFIPCILMALLALQWGGSNYPWRSATIIGLFLGFGGMLIIFTLWELHKGEEAMIPPSVLGMCAVIFTSLTIMLALGSLFTVVYYLPEWFQVVQGASPVRSGVMNIPALLSQVFGTILSGGLVTQLGPLNPWMWLGSTLMAVGTGLYCTFLPDTVSGHWIGFQIIQGFGFGTLAQMPIVAVQAALSPAQAPIGVSIATFAQFFGGAVMVAAAQAIFDNRFTAQLAADALPGIDAGALLRAGSGAIRTLVPPDSLSAVIAAFNQAIVGTFYLAAAASAASLLTSLGVPWINVKGKNLMAAPGEESQA